MHVGQIWTVAKQTITLWWGLFYIIKHGDTWVVENRALLSILLSTNKLEKGNKQEISQHKFSPSKTHVGEHCHVSYTERSDMSISFHSLGHILENIQVGHHTLIIKNRTKKCEIKNHWQCSLNSSNHVLLMLLYWLGSTGSK